MNLGARVCQNLYRQKEKDTSPCPRRKIDLHYPPKATFGIGGKEERPGWISLWEHKREGRPISKTSTVAPNTQTHTHTRNCAIKILNTDQSSLLPYSRLENGLG
jgi:hypothetical protein